MTTRRRRPPTAKRYVSYAWGDDKTPEGIARDQAVNELCDKADAQGYIILRDKNVMQVGDRISEFMKQIGEGDLIFVIMSDKYLRSPFCMFELSEIWRTSKQMGPTFLSRVRVYSLPGTNIGTALQRQQWVNHWKTEHDTLDAAARGVEPGSLSNDVRRELRWMRGFYGDLGDILATIADVIRANTIDELLRHGFADEGQRTKRSIKNGARGKQPKGQLTNHPKTPSKSPPSATRLTATTQTKRSSREGGRKIGSLPKPQKTAPLRSARSPRQTRPPKGSGAKERSSSEDDEQIREEKARKIAKLKAAIIGVLKPSLTAINGLAREMSLAPSTAAEFRTGADQVSSKLVDRLMNAPFNDATSWLSKGHAKLKADCEGARVIEDVSCHLIPFLYAADPRFDLDRLHKERIGEVVELPAGFPSFAEIVMAGIDARPLEYDLTGTLTLKNPMPVLKFGVEIGPEPGRVDMTEEQVRETLLEQVGFAGVYKKPQVEQKDERICQRLAHILHNQGKRFYYLPKMPELPEEVDAFRIVLNGIARRYQELAVIELDAGLLDEQLTLFDELRRLFRLLEAS